MVLPPLGSLVLMLVDLVHAHTHTHTFFALNYTITQSPSMNWTLSDSLTRGEGGCFLGESSLKSRSGGMTVIVIFLKLTLGELKFFASDRHCALGRNVTKSPNNRQGDRHFSTYNCIIFFPYMNCQRQLQLLCYFCLVMQRYSALWRIHSHRFGSPTLSL